MTITLTPAPAGFFTARTSGGIGLALFLNAGDPSFDVLADLVLTLDEQGVDCLELAVPFPNSVTDGPVIRRSAERALAAGADLAAVLNFLRTIRPRLRRLRIALLVDWSWSLKGGDLGDFMTRARDAGADAVLVHAVPPLLRARCYDEARRVDLPVVATCYATSKAAVLAEAAAEATAYLYLVAQYGRSGSAPGAGYAALAETIAGLRDLTHAPIAVGFGVRRYDDIEALALAGADAAIVGSAAVACIETASTQGKDPVGVLAAFLQSLAPPTLELPSASATSSGIVLGEAAS
ncbi:tryptophan synthase subunit alpha [Marinivivus vitaminiproducens]|uniref:tryptophan synthase subunit alpha n=1 Tax=Marinivivus vitaminiproducens TaxID=3035935 RepID=UPI0027AAAE0E|nr:tryptophan synthase subunit alpha [Geminicoccaceae bacterium SCSIO 64248]